MNNYKLTRFVYYAVAVTLLKTIANKSIEVIFLECDGGDNML